jgi:secreted trypsin-like serine protease
MVPRSQVTGVNVRTSLSEVGYPTQNLNNDLAVRVNVRHREVVVLEVQNVGVKYGRLSYEGALQR